MRDRIGRVLNFMLGGLALYGVAVGGLYVMQDSLIFPRHNTAEPKYPLPDASEKIVLTTPDSEQITGHLVRALGPSKGLLIGFSGNAWNADDCLVFLAHRVKDYDIAVFHYRGYAPSGGAPSQTALFDDATLIYDTLVQGMAPERVVAVGFSIGSGVASYIATTRDVAGLVLVTPFDSIQAIAAKRHPWAPVRTLLKHPFLSDQYIKGVAEPVAIIRASHDRVVPAAHTDALAQIVPNLVYDETIPDSTHGSIYDKEEIDIELVRALAAVHGASVGDNGI